jgi:hypothetical protein
MKNTLKPLPTFEAEEDAFPMEGIQVLKNTIVELRNDRDYYYKELRKVERRELQHLKDKERLDWLEKSDGMDFRKAIDKEMEASQ